MSRQTIFALIFIFALLGGVTSRVVAQNTVGSIRGTVYLDTNGNGVCPETEGEGDEAVTEPTIQGIPIEFVSDDGKFSTFLQSGDDGTYGLVSAGFGTWSVSARPNANEYVVTSEATLEVFLGSDQTLVLDNNFCVQAVEDAEEAAADATENTGNNIVAALPAAGGPVDNWPYLAALLVGVLLIGFGMMRQFGRGR